MSGHNKNSDHQAFKDPFPPHEKGESSKPKNENNKVNYMYNTNDNVINMVEPIDVEYYDVITIKGSEDYPRPKIMFVLHGLVSQSSESEQSLVCANVVTWSHAKIVLKGPEPSTSTPKQSIDTATIGLANKNSKLVPTPANANYSILDQLQCTNALITIFDLLKILPTHRQILDKALVEENVPKDLNLNWFQSMVGHLTSPHYISFSKEDDHLLSHSHNAPFHIEVMISQKCIHRVLIDNGAGLNIFSAKLLTQLGYDEDYIDAHKKITIKAYDEEE